MGDDQKDYEYSYLLERALAAQSRDRAAEADRRADRTVIPAPAIYHMGSGRTAVTNLREIAACLRRRPGHILKHLAAELGCKRMSLHVQRAILAGHFQPAQIERAVVSYTYIYVRCDACTSYYTYLQKNLLTSILGCEKCKSWRQVPASTRAAAEPAPAH